MAVGEGTAVDEEGAVDMVGERIDGSLKMNRRREFEKD